MSVEMDQCHHPMNANLNDRHGKALGYVAALAVVLITSAYPALTRLSVTTTLTPAEA